MHCQHCAISVESVRYCFTLPFKHTFTLTMHCQHCAISVESVRYGFRTPLSTK